MLAPHKLVLSRHCILFIFFTGVFTFTYTWAARTLSINWSSDFTEFYDTVGSVLSQTNASVNQDGAVVQLGYFSQAVSDNLFAGEWVPLTSLTSIGDTKDLTGYGDGTFSFTVHFKEGSKYVQVFDENDIGGYKTEAAHEISDGNPAQGTFLAMRFFNGTVGSATHYNTIASSTWQWTELSDLSFQSLELVVDAITNPQFEDSTSNFSTSIAISSWDYGKSLVGDISWNYLPWLGYYYQDLTTSWIYHLDHGWLYRVGNLPGDVWFYDQSGLGWIWSNADVYPYMYSASESDWLWLDVSDADRKFYHFGTSKWQTHNLSDE